MNKRSDFFLTKVLGFAKNEDGSYSKDDFLRGKDIDYMRSMRISHDSDGNETKTIRYLRSEGDEDPTPVDPFVSDDTKNEDKTILVMISMMLKTDLLKGEKK